MSDEYCKVRNFVMQLNCFRNVFCLSRVASVRVQVSAQIEFLSIYPASVNLDHLIKLLLLL